MPAQIPEKVFKKRGEVGAQAYIVGQRLNTKALGDYPVVSKSPLMIEMGDGFAVLFRFGAVVFFGVLFEDRTKFLEEIKQHVSQPHDIVETEDVIIKTGKEDHVSFDSVELKNWDIDRLLVIADVLAKSQILVYHELQISAAFEKMEPVTHEMQTKGYPGKKRTRELLSNVATTLATQRSIAGQVEILDKPDFLWDKSPEITGLFIELEDEYELRERHSALKEKLELIYRTSEMMLDLMNSRHTLHVEWYIVILIIIDIAIHIVETYVF